MKWKKLKIAAAQRERDDKLKAEKLKMAGWMIFGCLLVLLVFYGIEILIASYNMRIDPQIRLLLIEPFRFVVSATVGYLFSIRGTDSKE